MKIIKTKYRYGNGYLRCRVDSTEEFFALKKRVQENSKSKEFDSILFQIIISISPELAIKIYDEKPSEIDFNYLHSKWNLDELKYVFYNRPDLFNINSFLTSRIDHIDDDFARDILDKYHKKRPDLLFPFMRNKWLSPEIIVEYIDKYDWDDTWLSFLRCYNELGDDFLEKHWDKIKNDYYLTQEVSRRQKMSLEFMIRHEEDIDLRTYLFCSPYITKEVFLHYVDKWSDDEIYALFMMKDVILITADIADIVMPICFKRLPVRSLIKYINDGQCGKEDVIRYTKYLKELDNDDEKYDLTILESSEYTKYILTELRDKIRWDTINTHKLESTDDDISWFWNLIPDEYYNNIDKWNISWLESMPVDRLLNVFKKSNTKPFELFFSMSIYNRPSFEVLKIKEAFPEGFSYANFVYRSADLDINYIRDNKDKILDVLFNSLSMGYFIPMILKMIANDVITAEEYPSLNSEVNADILLNRGACIDGVLRFIANYGDQTYKAIDLLKDYTSTKGHKDALEDIYFSDVIWFANEFFILPASRRQTMDKYSYSFYKAEV